MNDERPRTFEPDYEVEGPHARSGLTLVDYSAIAFAASMFLVALARYFFF